uniref:Ig-like domain-containing protein n=1 Tax=Crocodylus porosus TaxID=8502 RepID=A0A7M4F7Q4_CROPO
STAEEKTKHIAGIVNGTVDLPPGTHIPKTYRQIKWFYNQTQQILTKKATRDVNFYRDFRKKMHLFENGTLHIMSLQKEDSSKYKIIVEDQDGSEIFTEIQLGVYDPVPKPWVDVTDFKMTEGKCVSTLNCSVDIPNVIYTWYENDKKYGNPSADGNLTLSLLSESNLIYNCNVCNSSGRVLRLGNKRAWPYRELTGFSCSTAKGSGAIHAVGAQTC